MKQKKPKDSAADFERRMRKTEKQKYVLRLYVAGMTTKSKQAIQSIKQICEEHLKDRCALEVIDVFRNPVLVKGEQIIATPTLLRKLPLPLRTGTNDKNKTHAFQCQNSHFDGPSLPRIQRGGSPMWSRWVSR